MTKFTANAGALRRAVESVAGIVCRRNTIPILSTLLFEAKEGAVRVTATDMDMELTAIAPAEISEPGALAFDAATTARLLRVLEADANVTISGSADHVQPVQVEAPDVSLKIVSFDPADFPRIQAKNRECGFRVRAADLSALFGRVRFAVSQEETRYYLNGVHVRERAGRLLAEATDGHRLAQQTIALPDMDGVWSSAIIPRRFVEWAVPIASKAADGAEVGVSRFGNGGGLLVFDFGPVIARTKLIDGTYPDADRVVPERSNKVATLDRRRLVRALDVVGSVRVQRSAAVAFGFDGARLTLTLKDCDGGEAKTAVPSGYAGTEMTVGLQWRYIRELARTFGGALLRVFLTDAANPTIFEDPDDPNFLVVQMPMRI